MSKDKFNGLDFWYKKAKKLEKENDKLKIIMLSSCFTFGKEEDDRIRAIIRKQKAQ